LSQTTVFEQNYSGQMARDERARQSGKPPTTAEQDARAQQDAQRQQTDATVAMMTELIQAQRQATTNLSDMSEKGIVPVGTALGVLAQKFRDFSDLLPGTRPRTQGEQELQAGGEGVGRSPNTGMASTEIIGRAKQDLVEITRLIDESAKKIGGAAGGTFDKLVESIGNFLKNNPNRDAAVPNSVPVTPPANNDTNQDQNIGPNRRSSAISGVIDNMSASVSRGYVNIESVDNIRFPDMLTSYRTSLDPDMMSRVAGFPTTRETTTETASTALRDSDLIASNALVSQKLDDLIEVMRRGVGYQRKISQVAMS
jgi:hypothetical protein